MPVDIGKLEAGPGWGCSCPSFKNGEPTPEQALAALARSANVTVEFVRQDEDGCLNFDAWTQPDAHYRVTWDPRRPGGWCKHCISCLVHFVPWFRQMALEADEVLLKIALLEKENKKLQRKLDKCLQK